ncbi:hypothetical protein C8J55DRAFT_605269 [Lentinula edodes]|uniref:Uncharacterized protein n=1 Tax=Lentinula lateritia TaxID=40482 RepID=A0A9W9AHB2_9AGAR|nr:hypothetical protein C8J55DRAFT_605269 [Lentinula edodes]
MSSFDSDPNNFNNTSYESQNRRREFDNQPDSMRSGGMNTGGGGYDQQASRFDNSNSNSMGGGGFDQQTPGRDQFSASGYNDDSFGPQSQTGRGGNPGRSEFNNERSYGGDSTGTQAYGAGNDFENNRSTGYGTGNTGSAYGTGNDFSGDRNDDSHGSGNNNKPSFGDKMKGTAEVAAGKMTKNPGMVERGQDRKTEGNNY